MKTGGRQTAGDQDRGIETGGESKTGVRAESSFLERWGDTEMGDL
jgi:hypothetical protein